jgi:hypothetical protein
MNLSISKSNFLFTSFVLIAISEWLGYNGIINFPFGFRHALLFFTFFVISFKNKSLIVSKKYLLFFSILMFYLFIAFFYSKAKGINYFIGFIFTFLFSFIYVMSFNSILSKKALFNFFDLVIKFLLLCGIIPLIQSIIVGKPLIFFPGIFRESGALGSSMNIGLIISLTLYLIKKEKKYFWYSLIFTFIVFATVLKKTIFVSFLSWIFFFWINKKYLRVRYSKLKIIIFFLILIFFNLDYLTWNINKNISYFNFVGVEGHVRLAMYLVSSKIIMDYFPFGSGLGTFGSFGSIIGSFSFPNNIEYKFSSVYYDYGIANLAGNSELRASMGGLTHLDTWWPHIFGELGVIGTLLFLVIWFFPIFYSIRFLKKYNKSKDETYFLSFFVIMTILSISLEGIALIQPEVPLFIFFHSGISGLICSILKQHSKNNII